MIVRKLLTILAALLIPCLSYGIQKVPSSQVSNDSVLPGAGLNDVLVREEALIVSNSVVTTNLQLQIDSLSSNVLSISNSWSSSIAYLINSTDTQRWNNAWNWISLTSNNIAYLDKTNNFTYRPQVGGIPVMLTGEVAPAAFSNITGSIFDNPSASNELIRLNGNINNISNIVFNLPSNNWNNAWSWVENNSNSIFSLYARSSIWDWVSSDWSNSVARRITTGDTQSWHTAVTDVSVIQTNKVSRDGSTPALGNWSMNTYRLTSLGAPINTTDGATKQYVDDLLNGLSWQDHVISYTNQPPTNVILSGRYLVATNAIGDFAGQADNIAVATNIIGTTNWDFIIPDYGWALLVSDTGIAYNFNGSWVQMAGITAWGNISGTLTNQTDVWDEFTNRYTKSEIDGLIQNIANAASLTNWLNTVIDGDVNWNTKQLTNVAVLGFTNNITMSGGTSGGTGVVTFAKDGTNYEIRLAPSPLTESQIITNIIPGTNMSVSGQGTANVTINNIDDDSAYVTNNRPDVTLGGTFTGTITKQYSSTNADFVTGTQSQTLVSALQPASTNANLSGTFTGTHIGNAAGLTNMSITNMSDTIYATNAAMDQGVVRTSVGTNGVTNIWFSLSVPLSDSATTVSGTQSNTINWIVNNSNNVQNSTNWIAANSNNIQNTTNWVAANSNNIQNSTNWVAANSNNIQSSTNWIASNSNKVNNAVSNNQPTVTFGTVTATTGNFTNLQQAGTTIVAKAVSNPLTAGTVLYGTSTNDLTWTNAPAISAANMSNFPTVYNPTILSGITNNIIMGSTNNLYYWALTNDSIMSLTPCASNLCADATVMIARNGWAFTIASANCITSGLGSVSILTNIGFHTQTYFFWQTYCNTNTLSIGGYQLQ